MGQRYILPHLQHFRVLREGGNGIVLEVCMNLTMDSVIKYIFLGLLQWLSLCC